MLQNDLIIALHRKSTLTSFLFLASFVSNMSITMGFFGQTEYATMLEPGLADRLLFFIVLH